MKLSRSYIPTALLAAAFAAVGLLVLTTPGGAQNRGGPCSSDVERLCPDVEPGEGRIRACLKENRDDVSAECKAHIEKKRSELRARAGEIRRACRADAKQFCEGVEKGEGRMLQCLRANRASLSQGCKDALQPKTDDALDADA